MPNAWHVWVKVYSTAAVFAYRKLLESHADQVKEADRALLDGVLQSDGRVLIIQVKDAAGKRLTRPILLVGWREGQPRLVGTGG